MSRLITDPAPHMIDWVNAESYLFLNPRVAPEVAKRIEEAVRAQGLSGHLFLMTSGTTARETDSFKVIALSKEAFKISAASVNHHLAARKGESWFCSLPLFHVGGLGLVRRAALLDTDVIYMNGPWLARSFHQQLHTSHANWVSLVPTQIFDLVNEKLQAPPFLKAAIVGGGALSGALCASAIDLGWPLLTSYGMTEMCSQVATAPFQERFTSLQTLELLDHVEAELNEDGLLRLRSSSQLTGTLFVSSDGTATWEIADQWVTTEDRAELFGRSIRVLGRGHDFAKILGENVSLLRLDAVLEKIILEKGMRGKAVVVAWPHERAGHELLIVTDIVVNESLREDFNHRVMPFERVGSVVTLTEWPETTLGKNSRARLLERAMGPVAPKPGAGA